MMTPADYFLQAQAASPDPFMVFRAIRNAAGTIVDMEWLYANPASERLLLRPPEQLPGRRLLVEMAESPVQGLFDAFTRVVDRNVGFRKTYYFPEEGSDTSFRLTAVRVEDGMALLATEVTLVRKVEEELGEMREQLLQAQKMETLGRLVGGVAHDFNNMLSAIMMNAHLLLKQLAEGDPSRKYSAEIDAIAGHAAALTHQILAYSGKQNPEPRVFSLNSVITDFSSMLRRLIGEEIELVTELDPEIRPIKADDVQMQQVILNLVINARDAIPDGGTITLRTENVTVGVEGGFAEGGAAKGDPRFPGLAPGHYAMFVIHDTGAGMSREIQPRVFDPHFSTKEQGTGLGLATVHSIIERSGGRAFVESEVGEGTTFFILIPEATESATPIERRASPARAPGGDETVLLVEDEAKLRVAMRRTLQRKGYRVLEAQHGEEALKIADAYEGTIHLLIADLVMPFMGGRVLARELKSRRPEIKVLFTSGYLEHRDEASRANAGLRTGGTGGEGQAEDAADAGRATDATDSGNADGHDFLLKPFTPYALAWRIREAIDGTEHDHPAGHRLG